MKRPCLHNSFSFLAECHFSIFLLLTPVRDAVCSFTWHRSICTYAGCSPVIRPAFYKRFFCCVLLISPLLSLLHSCVSCSPWVTHPAHQHQLELCATKGNERVGTASPHTCCHSWAVPWLAIDLSLKIDFFNLKE